MFGAVVSTRARESARQQRHSAAARPAAPFGSRTPRSAIRQPHTTTARPFGKRAAGGRRSGGFVFRRHFHDLQVHSLDSRTTQTGNMLTRPAGPLRKVQIAYDPALVHVVQLVNHHQILHHYAHGRLVRLRRLPCRRADSTYCMSSCAKRAHDAPSAQAARRTNAFGAPYQACVQARLTMTVWCLRSI